MKLRIDGKEIDAQTGWTLLDLIRKLELDHTALSLRPLAAKIAGEVFTLNYIPVRASEGQPDRPSIRRAMAASGGEIKLLRYGDAAGREAYIRTGQFVIFLAMRQLWPQAVVKMNSFGIRKFQVVTKNRPDLLKKEGDLYYFDWPELQLEEYFKRFGRDAVVLEPASLRNRLIRYYDAALKEYTSAPIS